MFKSIYLVVLSIFSVFLCINETLASSSEAEAMVSFIYNLHRNPETEGARVAKEILDGSWGAATLELSAVDYFFDYERNQFYASAGRFEIPEHKHKETLHSGYIEKINPHRSGPYSSGILRKPFFEFSNALLKNLALAKNSEALLTQIKTILNMNYEYWHSFVLRQIVFSENSPLNFAARALLVPAISDTVFYNNFPETEFRILTGKPRSQTLVYAILSRLYAVSEDQVKENFLLRSREIENFNNFDTTKLQTCSDFLTNESKRVAELLRMKKTDPGF